MTAAVAIANLVSVGGFRIVSSSQASSSFSSTEAAGAAGIRSGRRFCAREQRRQRHQRCVLGRESVQDVRQLWQERGAAIVAITAQDGRQVWREKGSAVMVAAAAADDDNAWLGRSVDREGSNGESSPAQDSTNGIRDLGYLGPAGVQGRRKSKADEIGRGRSRSEGDEEQYGGSKTWGVPENLDGSVGRRSDGGGQANRRTLMEPEPSRRNVGLSLQESKQGQDVDLERCLDEGGALLEEGMRGLDGRIEVGVAERMLYEAAKLFEKATGIDPTDLASVGQWGNTLLVHGELKLRLSQKLRSLLPSKKAAEALPADELESLELTLQEVCEECEELLMDAGRKFRMALSLDKKDVRGLYNWGLALSYRGQLIAEEGGERAREDADKVYLAAIDKFEAMLGLTQDYAPGALLNWGVAVRNRARLRSMGEKDRVRILTQAKELFQDALRLDPNFGQARGAVAVCVAELKELEAFELKQRQRRTK